MAEIFISYKREDKKNAALLARKLEASGWEVWWDIDLLGGDDYDTVIERELNAAKCVIVIWSVLSKQSRNVKDEAKNALNRNILVPVSFDNTEPPIGFGMTHVILFQNQNQITDTEYKKLYESVSKKLQSHKTPPPPPVPPSFFKRYGIYILALVVILVGFLIFNLSQNNSSTGNKGTGYVPPATGIDTGSSIETNGSRTKEGGNPPEETKTFEENLIALVKDSPDFFKASKGESLGYKKFGRVLDCNAYTSNIKLSQINSDTIFNCSGNEKTWTYMGKIIEGTDSVAMLEKFKEYKIKTEFAIPELKMLYSSEKYANLSDGKTNVLITVDRNHSGKFYVFVMIGPQ
jgi:hypothetical protein